MLVYQRVWQMYGTCQRNSFFCHVYLINLIKQLCHWHFLKDQTASPMTPILSMSICRWRQWMNSMLPMKLWFPWFPHGTSGSRASLRCPDSKCQITIDNPNTHPSWVLKCTLWLFNIAMENGPFIDAFLIKTSIYKGFSMAMLNNQRVYCLIN